MCACLFNFVFRFFIKKNRRKVKTPLTTTATTKNLLLFDSVLGLVK